jgi:hypothetical protein
VNIHGRAALFISLLAAISAIAATPPETIATQLHSSAIQADHGRHVENVTLHVGAATIELIAGTVFPATAVGDRPAEAVFTGRGSIAVKPDDPVEAGQLELFTSRRALDERFTEAIFVAASADTMAALTKGTPAGDPAAAAQAQKLYDAWKNGSERKQLDVESRILAAAVGDEGAGAFFAARLHGTHLGQFDYIVDPADRGMAGLGQFVPLNLTEREKRRLTRRLDKEHRRGRSLGTEVADLGYFNVWSALGAGLSSNEADFEPELYHIDATVADRAERLSGRATIDLRAVRGSRRVVPLRLHQDLKVSQVTDGAGAPLFFLRSGNQLAVVLPSPAASGKRLSITVAFEGAMFDKEGRAFRLRDTMYWHPHLGATDRARYDVTLHWPAGLDLLAAGKRVDGGDRWEKRALDIPVDGYTFEVGHFAIETIQAGRVNIRLAFDPESEDRRQVAQALQNDIRRNRQIDFRARGITKQGRDEIRQQLRDSLLFYEQLFGPYPLDELTVVTVPRNFSQGLPGFISLSTEMMTDPGTDFLDALFADVDRRLVVAHEMAHQWWGDLVSWANPRDQWLSEAMACYAASAYAQKLDWRGRFQIGFTTRWPSMLMWPEHGSRPIESLGPLVLGERLISSRAPAAYGFITYQKGALVMNMLANSVGEQKFHAILRDIVAKESQKSLSTEAFLGYVARGSGHDLQAFSRYFVYGTGIPQIEYRYHLEKGQGKWTIRLEGERIDPWRFRVRVVKRDDGKLDVVRETVPTTTAPLPTLMVPLQVALENRAGQGEGLKYAKRLIDISGPKFALDLDIPWEPKDVVLDRDREMPALFYSKGRNAKEVLLQRGTNLAALGKTAEAEAAFKEGVAATPSVEIEQALNRFAPVALWLPVGVDLGKAYKQPLLEIQSQLTNSALHLSLARLYIDQGKEAAAAEELKQANRSLDRDWREWIDDEVALLQSRIDLRHGAYAAAFDRMSKRLKDEGGESAEAYALLAVAAKQSGQSAELQRAVDVARELGVDVSELTAGGNSP